MYVITNAMYVITNDGTKYGPYNKIEFDVNDHGAAVALTCWSKSIGRSRYADGFIFSQINRIEATHNAEY